MSKSTCFLILILYVVVSCKKEKVDIDSTEKPKSVDLIDYTTIPDTIPESLSYYYPSKYCLIDEERSQELNKIIANDSDLFLMVIDSFGFLERDRSISIPQSIFDGPVIDKDSVLLRAKKYLLKYSDFTGVRDTSVLKIKKMSDNDPNRWVIKFEEQTVDGLKVYDSNLYVYLNSVGVYASFGFWYPEINIPDSAYISSDAAKQILVDKTFEFYGLADAYRYTIKLKDFYAGDIPGKAIIPFRNNDCIELRVCWLIECKANWNFYIDIITGRLIYVEPIAIA